MTMQSFENNLILDDPLRTRKTYSIDYMVLVNKTHKLSDDWEDELETVSMTNSVGVEVEVEKKPMTLISSLRQSLKKNAFMLTSTQRAEALPTSIVSWTSSSRNTARTTH